MKLMIADDMEGITGVVDWNHVHNTHSEYARFRKIMTQDVNAGIKGAFDAGVDQVVVSDGHGGGKNVLIEELDSRARINSGAPSPYAMVTGIDGGVDTLAYIGYHARAGTKKGVLAHTWSLSVLNLWLNDLLVGEIGLNASLAGHFGIPLIMISSDQAGCDEASALFKGVETVAVKTGTGSFAAECLPPEVTQTLIRETMTRAVKRFKNGDAPAPLRTSYPVKVTVELAQPAMVDPVSLMPYITRVDGRKVQFEAPDMPAAHRMFRMVTTLAAS
jgi:D-amino peptidase